MFTIILFIMAGCIWFMFTGVLSKVIAIVFAVWGVIRLLSNSNGKGFDFDDFGGGGGDFGGGD